MSAEKIEWGLTELGQVRAEMLATMLPDGRTSESTGAVRLTHQLANIVAFITVSVDGGEHVPLSKMCPPQFGPDSELIVKIVELIIAETGDGPFAVYVGEWLETAPIVFRALIEGEPT